MRGAVLMSVVASVAAHGHRHGEAWASTPTQAGLQVTTIGGSGHVSFSNTEPCRDHPSQHRDGPAETSKFAAPTRAQVVDGVPHVLDPMNGCIRTYSEGIWSSATPCCTSDIAVGRRGKGPQDMYIADDYYYLLDSYNNQLKRSPRPFEEWTVLAGNGSRPFHGQSEDGEALRHALNNPHGLAVTTDGSGDLYISETFSSCIKLLRNGVLTTIAGRCGFGGYSDGTPADARFQHPHHVNLDPRNESVLYVSDAECWDDDARDDMDYQSCKRTNGGVCFSGIRKIELDRSTGLAVSVSTVAGKATKGEHGKQSHACNGVVDGPTSDAKFNFVHGTAFAPLTPEERMRAEAGDGLAGSDAIYVCDEDGNRIRRIDLRENVVSTVAGSGKEGPRDGSSAKARFTYPGGIGLDVDGNIYVGDYESNRVRLISAATVSIV